MIFNTATFDDDSFTKTVDGGTYTVATDGTVTFVQVPSFTGTAPAVTVVSLKIRTRPASATYTPTVNQSLLLQPIRNTGIPKCTSNRNAYIPLSDETAQITVKMIDPATGQPTDEGCLEVKELMIRLQEHWLSPEKTLLELQLE